MRRPIATPGAPALILAVALAFLAGCGGKSATTSTTASTAPTTPTLTAATTGGAPATTAATPSASATATTAPARPPAPAPSSGPALPKAAFIGRADLICKQAQTEFTAQQKQIDAAGKADQAHDTPANRMAVADALRSDLTLAEQQLGRLRALSPPSADRGAVTAYFTAVANQLALVTRLASGIAANDATGVSRLTSELNNGAAQARILAAAYGFKVCGAGTA